MAAAATPTAPAVADCEWVVKDCSAALAERRFGLFGMHNYGLINAGKGVPKPGMRSALVWMKHTPEWPKIMRERFGGIDPFPNNKNWIIADTARFIVPHLGHPFLNSAVYQHRHGEAVTAAELIEVIMPLAGNYSIDARNVLSYTKSIRPTGITRFYLSGPAKSEHFFMALLAEEDTAPEDRSKWTDAHPSSPQFSSTVVAAILLHDPPLGYKTADPERKVKGKVFVPPGVTVEAKDFIRNAFEGSELYAAYCKRANQPQKVNLIESPVSKRKEQKEDGLRLGCSWCHQGSWKPLRPDGTPY